MDSNILSGRKIAVILESQYVPREIEIYQQRFASYGAEVHLMSRLWGNHEITFVSEVEVPGMIPEEITVHIDFTKVRLEDYAAIIQSANYTSVRERWIADEDLGETPLNSSSGRNSPAVKFFYNAMLNHRVIKAFPCHGLWILSSIPEVIAGRRVTCNRVMLGDVRNMGAHYTPPVDGVVVDADVVTNDSAAHSEQLVDAVRDQILKAHSGELVSPIFAATTPSAIASTTPVAANPKPRRILMLISEYGYWGEELVGPLEEFDRSGYITEFWTPSGKRPVAITVSMDAFYIDPPLGRSVTSIDMAAKVAAIDNPDTSEGRRLENPHSLAEMFPERPYWSDPQFVRLMEIYNQKLIISESTVSAYDALLIVGGSGPLVDLANNQRVHDLIFAFYKNGKPIAAECYGVACLAFARNIENRQSILRGKRVTGHCLEYDYKDGTGFMKSRGQFFDINMGPPPYPLEYILRDATFPDGAYIGNFGHPTSVIVDYPFITGRSTPDSNLTAQKLIEVLDGDPPLRRFGW